MVRKKIYELTTGRHCDKILQFKLVKTKVPCLDITGSANLLQPNYLKIINTDNLVTKYLSFYTEQFCCRVPGTL